jgi:hypothetical protein
MVPRASARVSVTTQWLCSRRWGRLRWSSPPHVSEHPYPRAWVGRGSPSFHFHLLPCVHAPLCRSRRRVVRLNVATAVPASPSSSKPRNRTAVFPLTSSNRPWVEPPANDLEHKLFLTDGFLRTSLLAPATARPPLVQLTTPQASPTSTDPLQPEELHPRPTVRLTIGFILFTEHLTAASPLPSNTCSGPSPPAGQNRPAKSRRGEGNESPVSSPMGWNAKRAWQPLWAQPKCTVAFFNIHSI